MGGTQNPLRLSGFIEFCHLSYPTADVLHLCSSRFELLRFNDLRCMAV
jgi:hypothetical protein